MSQTTCHEYKSCMFGSLKDGNSSIECYGYRSCERAFIIKGDEIKCLGSFSCYETTNIIGQRLISCEGLGSCANVESISGLGISSWVRCYGELSCLNSTMQDITSASCYGDHSCVDSQITSGSYNRLYGNLAALNTVLYSNYSDTYFYYFEGFESGYNATIICGDGHTCLVYCNGNSCKNLHLQCADNGNALCVFDINCINAQYDEINCPDGYQIPSDINEMPSLINVTMSTLENSRSVCNSSNYNINCDDYQDSKCYNQEISISTTYTNEPSTICCTGYQSCYNATNITTRGNDSSGDIDIRCDGSDVIASDFRTYP